MLYFLYNNSKYLIAAFGYYNIIHTTYDTIQKGFYIYNTAKYFIPEQQTEEKVIIIKEDSENDFIVLS